MESIFSGMPTVGSKKSPTRRDIDQSDLWVVSYPRKLWTPAAGRSQRAKLLPRKSQKREGPVSNRTRNRRLVSRPICLLVFLVAANLDNLINSEFKLGCRR